MKRLWVAFLAAALLVSSWGGMSWAASSHSSASSPADKITGCTAKGTISFMFWGDKGEKAEQDAAVKLAESACKGLHVNEIWDQGNYDNDLATKVGSGNAPDVFQLDASLRTPLYASKGALTSLDSYIKRDKVDLKKTFWASCLPMTMYKGHVYGLLRDCGSQQVLFYNKDMFDAKHVKYPTNKWTLTDFRNAAVKLTGDYSLPTDSTSKLRFGYAWDSGAFYMVTYLRQFGGDWLSKNLKSCTLTSSASQTGLNWWRDLRYKYHGAPTAQQAASAGGSFDGFRNQRYAMDFAGPWALDYIFGKGPVSATTPPTFKWGAVVTPAGPKGRINAMAAGMEVVYSGSHNKNAAWWLVRFLTTSKATALGGYYGIVIPGDKLVAKDPRIRKTYGSVLDVIFQNNKYGRAPRIIPNYDKFNDTGTKDLDAFWRNEQSSSDATKKACSDVASLLP